MLRSYLYLEKPINEQSVYNDLFKDKEIEIAKKIVLMSDKRHDLETVCPVCKKNTGKYFFTKWEVDYIRCEECKSIYAVCNDDDVLKYQSNNELINYRLSEDYQNQISIKRNEMWSEFLEWIEVRSFRFIKRNRNLNIIDVGNRLQGYVDAIKQSVICGEYDLRDSIICEDTHYIDDQDADIVFYFDQMQKELCPQNKLFEIRKMMKNDGLLFLGTRVGSGFDIITLKENNKNIYPYEHVFLPSVKGIVKLLEESGFRVLEVTTPGVMDVKYVLDSVDSLDDREGFVKYLLTENEESSLQDFQRFLQKNCLSSFVRIIAKGK